MTKDDFEKFMSETFYRLHELRQAGQNEYAGGENAFGNFERISQRIDLDRKKVLWTYLVKHLDGIESFLKGHVSQREPVTGRIDDAIVYLVLLSGMIAEEELGQQLAKAETVSKSLR